MKGKPNMDDLVIFKNALVWILLAVIAASYVVDVVVSRLVGKKRAEALAIKTQAEEINPEGQLGGEYYQAVLKAERLGFISTAAAGIGMLIHLGMFATLLCIKATLKEMLFLLMKLTPI